MPPASLLKKKKMHPPLVTFHACSGALIGRCKRQNLQNSSSLVLPDLLLQHDRIDTGFEQSEDGTGLPLQAAERVQYFRARTGRKVCQESRELRCRRQR